MRRSSRVTESQYRAIIDTVRLHFAELNQNGANLRTFDVQLEGSTVLSNFDIYTEAGGLDKAVARDFPVTISDGVVSLAFIKRIQNAKISAIEILPAVTPSPTPTATGTTGTATLTPTPSHTATATSTATPVAGLTSRTLTYGYDRLQRLTGITYDSEIDPLSWTPDSTVRCRDYTR